MSDPTERPAAEPAGTPAPSPAPATDADAWSTACAEDLAAEKARRRAQHGRPPGSAAEELRKLADAVTDKLSSLQLPVAGLAAQSAVQQLVDRAKAAVEPVVERNPDVFDHLAAAGSELLAAYRSAVERQESRWTRDGGAASGAGPGSPGSPESREETGEAREGREGPEGPSGSQRIDLD
ncbi:DUF5304 domain-containing protein [Streptomyces albus]|uniref:DUF5304 domain-containing protein n=1 Tax=Streptomyces albus TaxID=1888 RepID=UPI0004CACA97|nr:DUF5304 domain-containing protein [Streptomyces albus]